MERGKAIPITVTGLLAVVFLGCLGPLEAQTHQERARIEAELRQRALELERVERERAVHLEETLARLRAELTVGRERLRDEERQRFEELRAAQEHLRQEQRLRLEELRAAQQHLSQEQRSRREELRAAQQRLREEDRLKLEELRARGETSFERETGLSLASMNPGLSRYFSAEKGVLVLDVADGSSLGVQAGDVIQSIGGRDVESQRDVTRILGSYGGGDEISFLVVRQGRSMTVEGHRN